MDFGINEKTAFVPGSLAAFPASKSAFYTTGHVVAVDGGSTRSIS